jgi:hypothetical protein
MALASVGTEPADGQSGQPPSQLLTPRLETLTQSPTTVILAQQHPSQPPHPSSQMALQHLALLLASGTGGISYSRRGLCPCLKHAP